MGRRLAHAPHSLEFRPEAGAKSVVDLVVRGTSFGEAGHCDGQVTPMSPVAAYQEYGVEVEAPFLVIVGVEDAGHLSGPGTLMRWDGGDFYQVSDAQTFDAAPVASHSSAVFRRYQFTRGDL